MVYRVGGLIGWLSQTTPIPRSPDGVYEGLTFLCHSVHPHTPNLRDSETNYWFLFEGLFCILVELDEIWDISKGWHYYDFPYQWNWTTFKILPNKANYTANDILSLIWGMTPHIVGAGWDCRTRPRWQRYEASGTRVGPARHQGGSTIMRTIFFQWKYHRQCTSAKQQ